MACADKPNQRSPGHRWGGRRELEQLDADSRIESDLFPSFMRRWNYNFEPREMRHATHPASITSLVGDNGEHMCVVVHAICILADTAALCIVLCFQQEKCKDSMNEMLSVILANCNGGLKTLYAQLLLMIVVPSKKQCVHEYTVTGELYIVFTV